MQIEILSPGKTKCDFIIAGITEYQKRLKGFVKANMLFSKDFSSKKKNSSKHVKEEEGRLLLSKIEKSSYCISLDSNGKQVRSEKFAEMISEWEFAGRKKVVFVIGGHEGLSGSVLNRADFVLSLSNMTFTHEMSRLLLLEQIYRAYTIKHRTGYHK